MNNQVNRATPEDAEDGSAEFLNTEDDINSVARQAMCEVDWTHMTMFVGWKVRSVKRSNDWSHRIRFLRMMATVEVIQVDSCHSTDYIIVLEGRATFSVCLTYS